MNTPLATLALRGIFSATKKPKDEVDIPDPNLKTVLREALCLSDSEPLTKDGLAGLTALYDDILHPIFSERPVINDLTGLEYCTGLRSLTLYGPGIEDLTPLSALVNLRELTLQMTQCSPAPLLSLINLRSLTLWYGITDEYITLGTLPCLRKLKICGHFEGDIIPPLRTFENLACLTIEGIYSGLHDLTPLDSLTKLRELYLRSSEIADVALLRTLTNLQYLQLRDNHITDISPLSALEQLKLLDLNTNQITDIRPLKKLSRLKTLDLGDNQITDVAPLESLKNLQRLCLSGNQISDISPLKKLQGLSGLDLSNTPIADSMLSETIAEMKGLEAAERRGSCRPMNRAYPRNNFLEPEIVNGTSSF